MVVTVCCTLNLADLCLGLVVMILFCLLDLFWVYCLDFLVFWVLLL